MNIQVHETALVDKGAKIGNGTRIWHWVHVCGQAKIGEYCSLGQNVFIGNDVIIGNNCKIQNNVSIYDAVRLEDDVFCGPSMVFTNVYNPRATVERKNEFRQTLVLHVSKVCSVSESLLVLVSTRGVHKGPSKWGDWW